MHGKGVVYRSDIQEYCTGAVNRNSGKESCAQDRSSVKECAVYSSCIQKKARPMLCYQQVVKQQALMSLLMGYRNPAHSQYPLNRIQTVRSHYKCYMSFLSLQNRPEQF